MAAAAGPVEAYETIPTVLVASNGTHKTVDSFCFAPGEIPRRTHAILFAMYRGGFRWSEISLFRRGIYSGLAAVKDAVENDIDDDADDRSDGGDRVWVRAPPSPLETALANDGYQCFVADAVTNYVVALWFKVFNVSGRANWSDARWRASEAAAGIRRSGRLTTPIDGDDPEGEAQTQTASRAAARMGLRVAGVLDVAARRTSIAAIGGGWARGGVDLPPPTVRRRCRVHACCFIQMFQVGRMRRRCEAYNCNRSCPR